MRICILTQPLHTNYGGLLQAYALQVVLRGMGHKVWTEERRVDCYSLLRQMFRSAFVQNLLGLPRYLSAAEIAEIRQFTSRFISENITTTVPIYGTNKNKLRQYEFDAYVVGSDQVWRKSYTQGIENYFLDFAEPSSRKIAYAASFGVSQWEFSRAQTHRLRALAQRFNLVTVREADAVALCRDNLAVEAQLVLDPVLLLSKEEYSLLAAQDMGYPSTSGEVVSYLLDPTSELEATVQEFAARLNLEINDVGHSLKDNRFNGLAASERVVPPLSNWLSGFINSKYVVTDSFHGMLLAIIFNKQFVVFSNTERGVSRFTSLLSLLGLEGRLITDINGFDSTILCEPIDFKSVNELLELKRKESLKLLRSAL